jgi:pimeloyl-ACP methyl ester carboxylesterase
MVRKFVFFALSSFAALLTVILTAAVPARAQERTEWSYREGECRFMEPYGIDVECGFLTVPEDRSDPNSRTIDLHVAVFKATGRNPESDPILYLDGGPGGHTLTFASDYFSNNAWLELLSDRDFILFDQRGVGLSEPEMICYEFENFGRKHMLTDRRDKAYRLDYIDTLTRCRDRLLENDVNLSAYNSLNSAADVRDLREALGYDEWNVYGISYGTRLAFTLMRDYPEGIRSVIVDSPLPLQVNFPLTVRSTMQRSFQRLFNTCAADPACNNAYPNLDKVFFQTVSALDAEPLERSVSRWGQEYEVRIDGYLFARWFFRSLYSEYRLSDLPRQIWQVGQGDYTLLEDIAIGSVGFNPYSSDGMYLSVECSEEVSFYTPAEAEQGEELEIYWGIDFRANYLDACHVWDVNPVDPVENQPVTSEIPTLIMTGEFDPITPPDFGKLASETLPNSFMYEFPGTGHGASVAGRCPAGIMADFLAVPDRRPNDRCISRMDGVRFSLY